MKPVLAAKRTAHPLTQELLYLQTANSMPTSEVVGISLFSQGKEVVLPADPKDWPYESVLDALRDGWRVIKFPELALLLDEKRSYGLGCEFILERMHANT